MLVSAKVMLQFDITLVAEVQLDTKNKDLEKKSLGSEEIQRLQTVSLGSRKMSTYRAIDGKIPIRTSNWREVVMTSFDFEDNPFRRVQEEIDQLQS